MHKACNLSRLQLAICVTYLEGLRDVVIMRLGICTRALVAYQSILNIVE